ncbi:MAG: hypothetical protein IH606_11970 [Burkholderiales bacterium]|nr:hypothetical protein [Burkholderiales bacterium]
MDPLDRDPIPESIHEPPRPAANGQTGPVLMGTAVQQSGRSRGRIPLNITPDCLPIAHFRRGALRRIASRIGRPFVVDTDFAPQLLGAAVTGKVH